MDFDLDKYVLQPYKESKDMVIKTSNNLSITDSNLLTLVISMTKINNGKFEPVTMSFQTFFEYCLKGKENQKFDYENKGRIVKIIESLADKKWWSSRFGYIDGKKAAKKTLERFISRPSIYVNRNIVEIKLDDSLLPYYTELKENIAILYNPTNVINLKKIEPRRLYKWLRTFEILPKKENEFMKFSIVSLTLDIYNNYVVNGGGNSGTRKKGFKRLSQAYSMNIYNALADINDIDTIDDIGKSTSQKNTELAVCVFPIKEQNKIVAYNLLVFDKNDFNSYLKYKNMMPCRSKGKNIQKDENVPTTTK